MNWRIKRNLYIDLHHLIENTISGLVRTQEPDYIAALITQLPSHLSRLLNANIPYMKFNVAGCFIHQKPLVKFCDPSRHLKSPEIGDLLIVYKEIRRKETVYNALLLQAKKSKDIYHTIIPASDSHQLSLYTKWPKFEYLRAGILNGKRRSITPKTISPGAQYLLIDEIKSCGDTTFWCAMPDDPLVASNSLALQIIKLIEFQTGKPFIKRTNRNIDQWSKLIWDLLDLSASSFFNRRKAGYHKHDRYAGDSIKMLFDMTTGNANKSVVFDLDDGGISILCIEGDSRG